MRTIDNWGCPSIGYYLVERDGALYLDRVERGTLCVAFTSISKEEASEMRKNWGKCSYTDCNCNVAG